MARNAQSLNPLRLTASGIAVLFGLGVSLSASRISTAGIIPLIFAFLVVEIIGVVLCFLWLLTRSSAPAVPTPPRTWLPAQRPLAVDEPRVPAMAERLRAIDWFQFERLVAQVYRDRGFAVTVRGGAQPDGGVDLVVEKDGHRIAVQCKHWQNWRLSVAKVREFLGAMTAAGIAQGHLVVLNGWTADAEAMAAEHRIKLIGESDLLKALEKVNAAFNPDYLPLLDETQKHCAKCGNEMVQRTADNGARAGSRFWGCSTFPRCRFTLPVV